MYTYLLNSYHQNYKVLMFVDDKDLVGGGGVIKKIFLLIRWKRTVFNDRQVFR